ncbi:McbB family protein [Levilactobacillus brevis]
MKYEINTFFIEDIDDVHAYLMNTKTIINLSDKSLISMLHWIDENKISEIDDRKIAYFMNEKKKQSIEFLVSEHVLLEPAKEKKFSNIVYVTNDPVIGEMLNYVLFGSENRGQKSQVTTVNDLDEFFSKKHTSDNCQLFFILNPFTVGGLDSITKFAQKNIVSVRVAFFYNFKFYITNVYSPNLLSPCPMCFFYNLESSLRVTDRVNDSITFQNIVDLIYNQTAKFTSEATFTRKQLLSFISLIIRLSEEQSYGDVYELDYDSTRVVTDIAYHWELCDCYE